MNKIKSFIEGHKRELLIILIIVSVLSLTGCTNNTDPIIDGTGGWFQWLLVRPIAFLMYHVGKFLGDSYVLGLVVTTIIVRTIAWPIYAKTNDMSLKMSLAQPELTRLQQKYVTRKDPESQQKQRMEMAAIYKKYKINPLGCLLPLLQMPIFIAMYQVVKRITIEGGDYVLGNQVIFKIDFAKGAMNASGDTLSLVVGIILALLVGVSMHFMQVLASKKASYQKNIPNPNGDSMAKQMKMVNYVMIVMMTFMSLDSNSLALYWLIGNVYSIIQQQINRRINEKQYYKMKDSII